MEHRWGRRVPTDIVVRLDGRSSFLAEGRLRDASLSGGYVEGVPSVPLLTCIQVELEWGQRRNRREPHRVRAHVVRSDSSGLGLEWAEFAPDAIRKLLAVCESRIVCAAVPGNAFASVSTTLLSHGVRETDRYSPLPPRRSQRSDIAAP